MAITPSTNNKYKSPLQKFFEGRFYPFLVALAVLVGHVSKLEFYFCIAIIIAASASLLICDTIKPFLPTVLTFVYQVNRDHSPGIPAWSDYYSQTHVVVTMVIMFLLLIVCVCIYSAKNIIPRITKRPPLLISTSLLSLAFIMNGAFSANWSFKSFVFGIAEVAVFFVIFYLFYYGLKEEKIEDLLNHVSYLSLLVAMVLIGEVVNLFATHAVVSQQWGNIVKEEITLGWGVCNPIGFSLIILIPPLMRGAMKCRFFWVYLIAAVACWATAIFTMSRNSLLFGTLFLGLTFLIGCFAGKRKRFFRVSFVLCIIAAILCLIYILKNHHMLIYAFIYHGFSDNGRFELWKNAYENFASAPLFGTGFFSWGGMDAYDAADFLPTMAHNTFFQLISSMGAFGLISYVIYRIRTLTLFLKRISYEKIMLLLVVLMIVCTSLIDNFIFYFYTAFLYILVLAIAALMRDNEEKAKKDSEKPLKILKKRSFY